MYNREKVVILSVMKKSIVLTILLLAFLTTAWGQAKRQKPTPQKTEAAVQKPVVPPENRMFEQMLSATAKVMFVDSVVVDKHDFVNHVFLASEAGTLLTTSKLLGQENDSTVYAYENDYGNHCYYAHAAADSTTLLYSAYLLGNAWSEMKPLDELNQNVENPNYPFLQADGVTLYFSAKGEKSMGGYDIFMSIFDTEDNRFYEPQNMGLPFNSIANDYLLAIDEINQLGWLVTDRQQPDGKVCIYTFVPTETRQSFEADNLTTEKLRSLARIESIADTWTFGNREEALNRIAAASILQETTKEADTHFIINDQLVYRNADDFESAEARKAFQQLNELLDLLQQEEQKVDELRTTYHDAQRDKRTQMASEILQSERKLQQINHDIAQLKKDIRNKELMFINK